MEEMKFGREEGVNTTNIHIKYLKMKLLFRALTPGHRIKT
jgi:hypothetical protein